MGLFIRTLTALVLGQFDDGRESFRMSQERVKSKNLFNFRPQGFIDPVVVAEDEKMKQDFGLDPVAMAEHMKNQSESEFVEEMRGFMGGFLGNTPFKTDPAYVEAYASCNNSELMVTTKHDGEYNVKVLVHEPKSLAGEKNRPAIVYAHGGGCIGGTADLYENFLAHMAVDCRVVVYNVDYRLAPETRCPNNVLDYYEAIKYVAANAEQLGVDPSRIAMAGEGGGAVGLEGGGRPRQDRHPRHPHARRLRVLRPALHDQGGGGERGDDAKDLASHRRTRL